MIKMNPFRQTPGLCGPASLKILFDYYGKEYSEAELAEICNATVDKGTNHKDLIAAVVKIGHTPIVKSDASLDDIRNFIQSNIPVVVGWWSVDDDHYSVVYDINDKKIYLMDPQLDEGSCSYDLDEWMKIWHDKDSPETEEVNQWMMAVPPS